MQDGVMAGNLEWSGVQPGLFLAPKNKMFGEWRCAVLGGCQKSGAPHKMWKFYTSTTTIEINFE